MHDENALKGLKSVLYVPKVLSPDFYEVSARWTSHANRASNTPIDVISPEGAVETPSGSTR